MTPASTATATPQTDATGNVTGQDWDALEAAGQAALEDLHWRLLGAQRPEAVIDARFAAAVARHHAGTVDHGWPGMELWPEADDADDDSDQG